MHVYMVCLCWCWFVCICVHVCFVLCSMISPGWGHGSVELMKEKDLREQWEVIVGEWKEVICSDVTNRFR